MTYPETVEWMFAQLPMYQTQGASAFRKNLDNITLFCNYLGNPERNLRCIHVAGTNGKGSTCHLLASVFQQAGYKTGLFTSPHLKDYRERIKINGTPVSQKFVVEFIAAHRDFFEKHNLSFFEMSVGLCLSYFVSEQTNIAIIETGLGGRLDATNVVQPMLSVITNIGLEHTQYLGNTLTEIAGEKAGIIKAGVPVVIGETTPETKVAFLTTSNRLDSEIIFAEKLDLPEIPSDLNGLYQHENKRTVLAAIQTLKKLNLVSVSEDDIYAGFSHVVETTGLLGRWQQLGVNPLVIADTAHNAHGLARVVAQIERQIYQKLHFVLGVVTDKDLSTILPLLPKNAQYYFCKPEGQRGLNAEILMNEAVKFGLSGSWHASVTDAFMAARENASAMDMIYIGGSTFVVAEIL